MQCLIDHVKTVTNAAARGIEDVACSSDLAEARARPFNAVQLPGLSPEYVFLKRRRDALAAKERCFRFRDELEPEPDE